MQMCNALFEAIKDGNSAALKDGQRLLEQKNRYLDVNMVHPAHHVTALGWVCARGLSECATMLVRHGGDVKKYNADPYTRPLHAAGHYGHTECVRVLLDAGADINEGDKNGWTALMEAARGGRTAAARLLLDRGADRSLRNKDGTTALDLAKQQNKLEIVALLEVFPAAGEAARACCCR